MNSLDPVVPLIGSDLADLDEQESGPYGEPDADEIPVEAYDRRDAFDALLDACADAAEPDWNGRGAPPISTAARDMAAYVLDALPLDYPSPTADPTPDGTIAFEWRVAPRYRVFVHVRPTGQVTYTALLGPDASTQGTFIFQGDLPDDLLALIARVCS